MRQIISGAMRVEKEEIVQDHPDHYTDPLTRQSKLENMPPHTPKLPPTTGALALIAANDPLNLSPYPREIKDNFKLMDQNRIEGSSGLWREPGTNFGTVPHSLDTMPDGSPDSTHCEGAAKVVQDDPGTGIARMVAA